VKRISSSRTGFEKRVVPVVVVGAVVIGSVALAATRPIAESWWALSMALLFTVVFALLFRLRVWPLADEVFDCEDHLLVRRRGEEQRLRFADITGVALSRSGKSHRMTLRLAREGPFGDKIAFLVPKSAFYNPFSRDALERELAERAQAARAGVAA
jgi:hypothetical protein